ncbi:MAG TPA: hypothetical protein VFX30_10000 [bacterium]|nr:hypothetical protein [bacterium]
MGDPIITGGNGSGSRLTADAPPPPPPGPAAPVRVDSPHCLESSINDLTSLGRTLSGAPCEAVLSGLLPQITDSGNIEIQLAGPMNAGTYRGGVVVPANCWMDARLFVENGRLRGTIDFFPPLVKRGGIVGVGDATISQLQINTDPNTGAITFGATATYLNLSLPMTLFGRDISPMNVTEELTETLFGQRMSSIPGPASAFLQSFFNAQAREGGRLENLVNMAGVRFRIVANPREGDPLVPEVGPVSNAHIRLPELRLSPTVTLTDVDLTLEMHYNEETGGFRAVIPRASIGTIRHAPTVSCNGETNPGSEIHNVRLEDVTLNLDPRGDRDNLGNDTFRAASLALSTLAGVCSGQPGDLTALLRDSPLYPASGSGRILMDSGSIQGGDVVLRPLTGENAVTFNITGTRSPLGSAPGDLHVTVDAPELGASSAALILGGGLLQDQTAAVGLENSILRSLHATLDLSNGELSYNASFTPDLAGETLRQSNAEGNLLVSAAIMGFTTRSPITASGEHVGTADEIHRIHVENGVLSPSRAEFFNPLPARGSATFGFSGLGLDATFTRSGMHIDRLVLPEYNVGADVHVGGNHINASIRNGSATDRLLAGLGLVSDTADARGHVSGVTHTASVNTRIERVRFTAMGGRTFEMTGTLTGSMGLVDKHTAVPGEFVPPDFRPTLGGMDLRLNGTVREIGGSGVRLSGASIRISDDARGHVVIAGNTTVNVDGEAITASARIGADLRRHLRDFPYTRPGSEAASVRYYDFDPDTDLNIPLSQVLVEAAMPGVGTLRAIGSGRISGRPANPNFDLNLPFGEQHLAINRPGLPVTGTVDLNGGGLTVSGNPSRLTLGIRPPETVHVAFTQERDGVTYTYAGDLRSTSSFRATVNPRTGRVSFNGGGTTPQLTGDLTVTATTMRDGNRVTLGAGTAHVSTTYSISGTADSSGAHIALTVPETGLSGSLTSDVTIGANTIPAGTAINVPIRNFSGNIDLNTSTGGFTSRWTAGDIGPARVTIPSIALPGGINFTNVTAEFSAVANGQQWEVARDGAGRVTFRAVPGADGNLPPFEVNFGARDGDGSNLALTLTSSSRARDINGSVDAGEMVFDVTGMTLGSRLGGSLTIGGRPIDLSSGLMTDANMPRLQVRVSATGAMRLVATPPTPPVVTAPPTDLNEWMAWTTDQWRNYQTQINTSDPAANVGHMVTMSEQVLSMPLMDAFLPPGRGRVYIDMDPLDVSIPAGAADGPQQILTALQNALHMSREFPNPPPRSGTGEPMIVNDAQRPLYRPDGAAGTLFIIREARTGADPRLDPDLAGNLELLLGANSDEVGRIIRSGRLEMSDLVTAVRRNPAVASAIDEPTLTALVNSYMADSGGSFRRFSQRMAIALGTIRSSTPAFWTTTGGMRPIHTHDFADPSYHVAPSGANDGSDMEFMAVLPITPAAAAGVLTSTSSRTWDPWVSSGTLTGATDAGVLLGDHRFSLTQTSSTDGNISVIRMASGSGSDLAADARTFRLVPLSGGRTLMIMDQHEDMPGADIDARFDRMRLPDRPALTLETFGTNALTLINPRPVDTYAYYANRFAQMAGRITASANATDGNILAYDSREPFSAVSRSSRVVEYLTLDTTDAANPALRIGPDASAAAITSDLTSHLGVTGAVASRWITAGRIPLSELLTETRLNTVFTVPVIQAAATALLNPPSAAVPTMRHFSSPTERFLLMMEDLRRYSYLSTPAGGAYNTITRDFNHPRFHLTSTENTPDTVDTFMYWYVPTSLGITADNITWFVHHADQFPAYDSNFASSSVVDRSTISGASADRTYIDTGINVDMLGAFNYRISVPNDPLTLSGGVLFSPWAQEPSARRDFLINNGWWLTLPTSDGSGFVVVRGGVINTRLPADRDPTAASTAQGRVIGFMPNVLRGAAAHQGGGVPTGTIPTYNSTPAILYNQRAP